MEFTDKRTEKRKTGDAGEELAAGYISKRGYRVIARNVACKTGELDIVAINESDGILAFIEVKSRDRTDFGLPCEAVDFRKQQRLKRTAQYFMMSHRNLTGLQPSMDIIEILRLNGNVYIRHLKNAF